MKEVESVAEIVEIYQHAMTVHVHSRIAGELWSFGSINGADKSLALPGIGVFIPLSELYEGVVPDEEAE